MNDEDRIAEIIESWHRATVAGDVDAVLRLMTDDVVFLAPGQPPMRKDGFEKGLRGVLESHAILSSGRLKDVKVFGGWAYAWSDLSVTVSPRQGGPSRRRTGPALSIFRREPDGEWRLARDANMLAAEPKA
jgi:uncharacterized protein (TIGR02246 family)